jgi:pimeloyl-ACP methyl ester carboxylesterase
MRGIIFVILSLVLLFGCVGEEQKPAEVNVTTNLTTDIQTTETGNQTTTVSVDVNQTTQPGDDVSDPTQTTIKSEEIVYKTSDNWDIYGTLYYAKDEDPKRAVILIHMLGSDRSSYDPLIPVLHEEMTDADILAIDARGHGKSTNLGTTSKFKYVGDWKAMGNDIGGAVEYFRFYRNMPDEYYVVGASIGSTSAIHYAASNAEIQRVVMISPGMNYKGVDISEDLENYRKRLLVVAAENDLSSAKDAKTIYSQSKSGSELKKLYIYNGTDAHGTDLFSVTKGRSDDLTKMIADWLSSS